MITAEELVLEVASQEESKNFKLATVIDLFENDTAKLKFDGEDVASEKEYAYLDSYTPTADDRVLLGVLGGTYVILGKINYNVSPSTEEEIDRYLFDLKQVIIQKGLNVTGSATFNSGATVMGDVGVDGNVNAVGLSATGVITGASLNANGQIKGGSLSTTGSLNAGASDLDSLDVSGTSDLNTTNISGVLTANGSFIHKGNALSFFNVGGTYTRISIGTLTGTVTADQVKDRLNDLITALGNYGLIRRV